MELKNRKTVVLPFAGSSLYRDTSAKDQRYTNILLEKIKSSINGEPERIYVVKRPGLAQNTRPPDADATPRGIHFSDGMGKLYTVFANKIYAGTTDLGVTLDASSGKCWFTESPSGWGGGQRVIMSDGTKLYIIQSDNTVTTVSTGSDADFPTNNLGPILFYNSYIVLANSNGEIWNSDVDSGTAWSATSFLSAELHGDALEAIAKQKDHIVAMGLESIEFFYDNANTPGSPFERRSHMTIQVGLETKNSLAQAEDAIAFVGHSKAGLRAVWLMTGLDKIQRVSTAPVEKLLESEGSNISACSAYLLRTRGQFLYILNLSNADRTLVYNIGEDHWSEWADPSGGKFDGAYATAGSAAIYMQDNTNGRTYTFSPTTYQDNGSNFSVTLLTDKLNFGTDFQKFCSRISINGDTTTGNLAVSFSDDDYANFNTARNIDLSTVAKYLPQLGNFRRRAWKFVYTANAALRLESFELDLRQGIR
jgi:hypothetical protein